MNVDLKGNSSHRLSTDNTEEHTNSWRFLAVQYQDQYSGGILRTYKPLLATNKNTPIFHVPSTLRLMNH